MNTVNKDMIIYARVSYYCSSFPQQELLIVILVQNRVDQRGSRSTHARPVIVLSQIPHSMTCLFPMIIGWMT